jgi:hypothetical protein
MGKIRTLRLLLGNYEIYPNPAQKKAQIDEYFEKARRKLNTINKNLLALSRSVRIFMSKKSSILKACHIGYEKTPLVGVDYWLDFRLCFILFAGYCCEEEYYSCNQNH